MGRGAALALASLIYGVQPRWLEEHLRPPSARVCGRPRSSPTQGVCTASGRCIQCAGTAVGPLREVCRGGLLGDCRILYHIQYSWHEPTRSRLSGPITTGKVYVGEIQERHERFISAFSGQSTPGVAAGVTGAEQRLVGGTHDPIVCAANKSAGVCRSSFKNARGLLVWRRSERYDNPSSYSPRRVVRIS